MSYDFTGRVAFVTGAAGGLGAEVVRKLSGCGAVVVAFDLRDDHGHGDLALAGDITDSAAVNAAVARAEAEFGRIDLLVCAAGIAGGAVPTAEVSDELWDRVMAVNATGLFYTLRAVTPGMARRGYGRVVNFASIAATDGLLDGDVYAASKAAVVSITRTVGRGLAGTGVLVNCVQPALIDTGMAADLNAAQLEIATSRIPLGRPGRPEEVANLVAFLCSEDLSFSTGAMFDITGGRANR
jgi:NAD(P)-dependent dehydrogenase (short-subunit alcohol dehydrogenase family)